jgi:hypothetical protein
MTCPCGLSSMCPFRAPCYLLVDVETKLKRLEALIEGGDCIDDEQRTFIKSLPGRDDAALPCVVARWPGAATLRPFAGAG